MNWLADAIVETAADKQAAHTEAQRRKAQQERDKSLNGITHTFADGRVIQVRPQDLSNVQLAIARGVDRDWVLADNTVSLVTIAELQEAMESGIAQGEAIWDRYMSVIASL